MIGLEYIAKEFHLEYKEIAESIGISKQTIQDWLKQRRKIPKKRLEQLSSIFNLPESYFQKELDHIEKAEITMTYLKSVSEDIKIPEYNEEGEIIGYYLKGTYEEEIRFLSDDIEGEKKRNRIRKGMESLIQEETLNFSDSIYKEKVGEPLRIDSSNITTLNKIINIIEDTELAPNFKVIVHLLNINSELGGNILASISPEYRSFAKDILEVLKKYKIKE
ncbi:helix-turn-helix domain-containing protein [Bacillus sp. 123MFChir2]|uniref:helix-turn-helix domain-containing protein n=1 Tax=Bacillus sp. 123MFChir2 TaxID=1169144 RepID=UPI000360CFFF|nr:helix-turn-helix transcriptional regulator [Bacillus sp. 123MFChir2]